ncbi:MAG: hypothetical protein IPF61_02815 [Xanthomonadales bacterium]|nr:hypothetical protein [Xanthomonadales bacterium]
MIDRTQSVLAVVVAYRPDVESLVLLLRGVARDLLANGVRVGYVGAAYVDGITGHSFGFQVQEADRYFYSTRAADAADPWVEVITGITSGSLHPCRVFADVGMMREDWFIDYVDTEWFHRARARGYRMFGTSRAVLSHHLGDLTFRVWYGRWRNYNGYSPRRLYYRFRNFVLLMRCGHVPSRWKVRACWYWLGNAYAYLLFSPNRWQNLKFTCRGLWDGLRGRVGSMDPSHCRQQLSPEILMAFRKLLRLASIYLPPRRTPLRDLLRACIAFCRIATAWPRRPH